MAGTGGTESEQEISVMSDGTLRYSMVWEDEALLRRGLDMCPSDVVLSVASAGCNVLNLLLLEPSRILAVDMNMAQLALLELKLAALKVFDRHEDFVRLFGLGPFEGPAAHLYASLRGELSSSAREWWEAPENQQRLEKGIAWDGRLETFFRGFGATPSVDRGAVGKLFECRTLEEQQAAWESIEQSPAFREDFVSYFGAENQKRGRSAAQLRHVPEEQPVGEALLARCQRMMRRSLLSENVYLAMFFSCLHGHPVPAALWPPYLQEANFLRLKALSPRVEIHHNMCQDLAPSLLETVTKANLSDIFEYMADSDAQGLFRQLAASCPKLARVGIWNFCNHREPDAESDLQPLPELSRELAEADRVWFYSGFYVLGRAAK